MWDIFTTSKMQDTQENNFTRIINPNTKTALAAGIDRGYSISNFLIVKNHIYQS